MASHAWAMLKYGLILKYTWNVGKQRVKQDLMVRKLDNVSVNKIVVTKFVTVKVSQNLNLMQSLSTQ